MTRENVIILKKAEVVEAWGSLTEVCRKHSDFPYHTLKKRTDFPFVYDGWEFYKVPFRCKYLGAGEYEERVK